MFAFRETRGGVEVAFTDRFRGGPGSEEILDLKVRYDEAAADPVTPVQDNFRLVAQAVGVEPPLVAVMHQVHGADVVVVSDEQPAALAKPPLADGLVTSRPGWILAARAADCVPVLLADPSHGVVGAAHAGRKGLVAGVVPRTVAAMRELGAEGVVAWIGPHACGRCYEVPDEMRGEVAASVPEAHSTTSWGTPAVDLGAGVAAQLRGVGCEAVDVGRCTIEDPELFSHRRDGPAAGRHAGLVWLRRLDP